MKSKKAHQFQGFFKPILEFSAALKSFLDESLDIFSDRELLDHLNDEVPVIMRILAKIKEFEKKHFPT